MSTTTPNLGLVKPAEGEAYSVPIVNSNSDKIDEFAGKMANAAKVTDLNDATGNNRIYYFDTGASNAPSAFSYGFVEVMAQGNNVHQTAVGRGGTDVTYTYERSRNASGTWGSWESKTASLNSQIAYTGAGYTPTINAGTGAVVENIQFTYRKIGKLLIIGGRFNITTASSTNNTISISLPSGMTALAMGVGSCGGVYLNKSYSGVGLSMRCDGGTTMYIQAGSGGYSSNAVGTGYVMVDAVLVTEN